MASGAGHRAGGVVVAVPGDGWCLFHAVARYGARPGEGARPRWCLRAAAEIYLQALEWLWAALAGPDAAATEAACVPETEAELERHRDFVRRRGGVEAQVPDAKLVLWSKVLAVVEQPNGLDSFHHGTSAELWALTQQFDFDAIVWSGVPDANYWARTQTRVTDEECRTAVARLPTVLQLLHREIGNVGHYDLLGTDAVSPQPFARTPWVRRWAEGGSEAMWEVLGMPRRPERIHAPIPEAEADVWSEPETNSDVVLSDKNSDKIDMETDSVPRRPERIHAPIPEAEADVWSEPETNRDVPLSDKNSDKIEMETDSVQSWDSQDASDEAEELGPVAVEASKTWTTLEDTDVHLAEQVASLLRPTPLLPPPLPAWSASMSAPASGIVYPAVHCAFAGCAWCSEMQPCQEASGHAGAWVVPDLHWTRLSGTCCGKANTCLWAHLAACHWDSLCAGQPGQEWWQAKSRYMRALVCREEASVPAVGWSVDRRTLRRLRQERREEHCVALVCACCAAVQPGGPNGNVGYVSVRELFTTVSAESFAANWSLTEYIRKYGEHAAVRDRLPEQDWQLSLPPDLFEGQRILCCPEDRVCAACPATQEQLCAECKLPLCRTCWSRSRQSTCPQVPQALANDNWYGYPPNFLYQEKVRWIEAAAACPVWTSVVSFYIEEDRGHLMEEELHRSDFRVAVRGNVSSFSMPWEEIYGMQSPPLGGGGCAASAAARSPGAQHHDEVDNQGHAARRDRGVGGWCKAAPVDRREVVGAPDRQRTSHV